MEVFLTKKINSSFSFVFLVYSNTGFYICGFHGGIESAYAIMKGLEINYNFNRKHMALGKRTPAEIAIPQLELGVNKWLDLIKMSKL